MRNTLGKKSFVIGLGLAMLLSTFIAVANDSVIGSEISNSIFYDDFDSETVGSIPLNWNVDSNFIYDETRIDNSKSLSNPNSMHLKSKVSNTGRLYCDALGSLSSDIVVSSWIYIPSDAGYHAMSLHSESADWAYENLITQITFDDSIGYISGTPRKIIYYSCKCI